jgi:hypothetical protein
VLVEILGRGIGRVLSIAGVDGDQREERMFRLGYFRVGAMRGATAGRPKLAASSGQPTNQLGLHKVNQGPA